MDHGAWTRTRRDNYLRHQFIPVNILLTQPTNTSPTTAQIMPLIYPDDLLVFISETPGNEIRRGGEESRRVSGEFCVVINFEFVSIELNRTIRTVGFKEP